MLTKILNKFRGTTQTGTTSTTETKTSEFTYSVTIPGQEPVILRAKNQVEVKAFVRESLGLTRLPAGTTVERLG